MKTPLALLNLTHQSAKTMVSVGGVAFALLLVFMQLGFMGAVSHTATNVYEHMRFDALVRSSDYLHLYEPGNLDLSLMQVAQSTRGVRQVLPVWVTLHNWRSLQSDRQRLEKSETKSQLLPMAILAIRPEDAVFDLADVEAQAALLTVDNTVLVDVTTHDEYGPKDGRRFTTRDIGRTTEIGGQHVKIAGVFRLGTGLAANGQVLTSASCFRRLVPWDAGRRVSMGLLQFDRSANEADILARLRERLEKTSASDRMASVQVLSQKETIAWERRRWLWETPIGLIFQLGVGLSLLVGAAIVYLVLATDVANRLHEYATLLAIGYSRQYLAGVVMTQAIALAGLGFLVSWGVSELLYRLTSWASGIPIMMNNERVVAVAGLGLVMCCVSGLLALRKLWKAEPASLF